MAAAVAKVKHAKEREHESHLGIRLDYSDTYIENESLDHALLKKIASIHKEKYRVGIERDESLKEVRKAAEDIQKLSEAIKKGTVQSSVPLLSGNSKQSKMEGNTPKKNVNSKIDDLCSDIEKIGNGAKHEEYRGYDDERAQSPENKMSMNTLTMFALSYQKFVIGKGAGSNLNALSSARPSETKNNVPDYTTKSPFSRSFSAKNAQRAFPRFDRRPKLRRPLTVRQRTVKDGQVLEASDCLPIAVYSMRAKRSKTSKSRRELQEMSKLEQNEKFGQVEKIDERKKKLQAWARGEESRLSDRIRSFVKNCEDFSRSQTTLGLEFDPTVTRRPRTVVY